MLNTKYLDHLLDQASISHRVGNFDLAIAGLREITRVERKRLRAWPNYPAALAYLAASLAETGQFTEALERQAELLSLSAGNREAKANFLRMLRAGSGCLPVSKEFRAAVLMVLDQANPSEFSVPLALMLLGDPAFRQAADQILAQQDIPLVASLLNGEFRAVLHEPLLQRLMREAVIPVPDYERLFRRLRKGVLRVCVQSEYARGFRRLAKQENEFLGAFAQYLWLTEHAPFVDEEEAELLASLVRSVEAELSAFAGLTESLLSLLTVYALYRPWWSLAGGEALLAVPAHRWPSALRPLLVEWMNRRTEDGLKPAIESLTSIDGGVSARVRHQYEENPYPRWTHRLGVVERMSLVRLMGFLCPSAQLPERCSGPVDVLVAGCGTGLEAFTLSAQIEANGVLAIDLSRSSLAYAIRMARTENAGANIEFRQADILTLGALDRRFDFISSSGVLHHLEDPMAGWRILTGLLRPGGLMAVGLYSEFAGQTVIKARGVVAAENLQATPEDMRKLRQDVLDGRRDELALLPNWRDFYSLSMFRDLVFHVNEHRYTLPRIKQCLDELGLVFLGMDGLDPQIMARYRQLFPDDPWGLSLDHWHRFEQQHPLTFVGMYRLFLQKR